MNEFKNHMLTKLKNLITMIVAAIAGFGIVYFLNGHVMNMTFVQPQAPHQSTEVAKDSPAGLFEMHKDDCWRGSDMPKAELPGAAIVQFEKTGKAIYISNETPRGVRLVDAAFNEVLAQIGYGDKESDKIDVVALCI